MTDAADPQRYCRESSDDAHDNDLGFDIGGDIPDDAADDFQKHMALFPVEQPVHNVIVIPREQNGSDQKADEKAAKGSYRLDVF